MSTKKNIAFEKNRKMDNLEEVISRQEEIIQQLQQQMEQQQQQMQLQQQQLQIQMQQQPQNERPQQQQNNGLTLNLCPKDILEQFRKLKPLDKNHNPRAFTRSVESVIELCNGNQEILKYGLNIVANEKIQGDYGKRIRMLEIGAAWNKLKKEILISSQPMKTYAEIYNFCRKALIMVLLLMSLVQLSQATPLISQINENHGFIETKTGDVELVNETYTIIHIINISEIEGILNNISINIASLDLNSNSVLQNEINLIRSKIKTLLPPDS
ncbi:type-2 histone deacetylase 2-like [Musca domestica]|uniref:Type-2 histone deacetylase 2-like n=1 Tax=Musca domestica TaxID=7370 RepID=A0ABM3VAJ1_MUSDO|nr:type-2 histone deacetylase 2-like [Musca domestica]